MSYPIHPPTVLDALRKFDTPTVCNVIELFDHCPRTSGYMDGRIKACYPHLPPMVGFAVTATFRAGAPPRAAGDRTANSAIVWLLPAPARGNQHGSR